MRLIDRLLGWREITTEGEGVKCLCEYLLRLHVPAELETDGQSALVRVGRKDGDRIVRRLKENGFSVQIGALRGLPAFGLSLLRRPGILFGVACVFLLLFFARTRVWAVEIRGDGTIDEDEIRTVLFESGLRPGIAIRGLSTEAIATQCLLRKDLFSGMNVSRSGVVVRVEWFGRRGVEPISFDAVADGANLVASCDGVIVSVEPTSGTAVVVPGQTVHKGDLLISGVNKGGTVRASGVVMAKVTEEFSATSEKTILRKSVSGAKMVSLSLRMFGEDLFSFGGAGDSAAQKDLTLPGGVILPFSLRIGYAHKTEEETVELTEAEAAAVALRRLNWVIREALSDGELLKKEVSGVFSENGYTATARTEYLINIAKPLEFSAKNEYNK